MVERCLLIRIFVVALVPSLVSCAVGEIPEDFEFLPSPFIEAIDDLSPPAPMRIDVGAPIYSEQAIPMYPDAEIREALVKCDDGRPLCVVGSQCFGWVEFSFTLSDEGEAELPLLYAACPYPVIMEPFLQTLRTWRFNPHPAFKRGGVFGTTILAYPLDIST